MFALREADAAGTAEVGWTFWPGSSLDPSAAATNVCHPGPRAGIQCPVSSQPLGHRRAILA